MKSKATVHYPLTLPSVGDRIRLIQMSEDPHPVPPGTEGIVTSVVLFREGASIGMQWIDCTRTLNLSVPPDTFTIVKKAGT